MFKKTISILMAIVFVLSLMPMGALAEVAGEENFVTGQIPFTNYAYSRHDPDNAANREKVFKYQANDKSTYHVILAGGVYDGYAQLNFSGYEEILGNKSTTATYKIGTGGTGGQQKCIDFKAYVMPDNTDGYSWETINGEIANTLGLNNIDGRPVLFERLDNTGKRAEVIEGDADLSKVVNEINGTNDNSIITLCFDASSATYLRPWDSTNESVEGLYIKYNPAEISNDEYVDTLLENISELKDLTGDDDITKTGLPKTYRGMDITWVSSDPDYISTDGVITQHPEAKDVILTATFSYKGIHETAKTGTAIKEFKVNVPAETPVEVTIPFTNYAYSRESKLNEKLGVLTFESSGVTHRSIATGGDYNAYTQFNLKGYEEILKNSKTSIQIQLKAGYSAGGHTLTNIRGVLASDKADSYKWDELTCDEADKLGLHDTEGRPVLFTKNDDVTIKVTQDPVKVDANKEALVAALEENNTNSVVSVYLEGLTGTSYIRANNEGTCLIIKYYKSEIDEDAYYADIQSSFVWENITSDAQEALVNKLPTYYKGADIVWSSEKRYVTSSGELDIPSDRAMADDVLTAHVTYKDKSFTSEEFEVTICDGSLILGTPALTVEDGVASGSFAVTNATGEDISYILYLAEYNGGEMVNLVPETINAVKGIETSETITAKVASGNKVKFLVWKADGITPAIAAIEK